MSNNFVRRIFFLIYFFKLVQRIMTVTYTGVKFIYFIFQVENTVLIYLSLLMQYYN